PRLPFQYADFAYWQRQRMTRPTMQEHLAYWRKQFSGPLPSLELPTDWPRPPVQTFRGATHEFTLPLALSQAVKVLAEREGATPFMTLLGSEEHTSELQS